MEILLVKLELGELLSKTIYTVPTTAQPGLQLCEVGCGENLCLLKGVGQSRFSLEPSSPGYSTMGFLQS